MRGDSVVNVHPVLQNQNSNNLEKKHKLQEVHTPNTLRNAHVQYLAVKRGQIITIQQICIEGRQGARE